MVVIKLQLNNDIRRVNVPGPLSFKDLHELAKTLFENTLPQSFQFKYKDDEGDLITVSSDRELEEAFRLYKAQDILRLTVAVPEKPKTNSNNSSSQSPSSFFDVLEKLVSENGFIRDLLNNLEVDIFSTPNAPKQHCSPSEVPQAEVVHNAICDGCESQIKGIRYKCISCPDYDLCQTCLAKGTHSEHHFVEILRPSRRGCPMRRPDFANGPFPHNAICDSCETQIRGIRYKCQSCPDFDLCEKCYNVKGVHNPEHKFDAITRPCPWRRPNGNANCSRPTNQSEVIHPATCDGCHQRIKGLRYKCNNCIDFDLCQSCKDKNIHNEHSFTTLSKPVFTPPGWKPEPEQKVEETKAIPVSQTAPQKEATVPLMKIEPVPVKVEAVTPSAPKPEPVKVEPVVPKQEPVKVESVVPKPEPVKVEPVVPSAPKLTPPSSPAQPIPGRFEQKLKQLEEMGFPNRSKNIEFLVKRNGDMILVVKDLLDA